MGIPVNELFRGRRTKNLPAPKEPEDPFSTEIANLLRTNSGARFTQVEGESIRPIDIKDPPLNAAGVRRPPESWPTMIQETALRFSGTIYQKP